MALQNIIDTIKKEADAEAKKILSENDKKIKELKKEYEVKREDLKQKMLAKVKAEAEKKVEQERFAANSKAQSALLQAKQALLDEIFVKAVQALAKSDEKKQVKLLEKLIKSLPKVEKGEIKPTKASSVLVKKAVGTKYPVSDEIVEGKGGFVFVSGDVEVDNRYEALIKLIRDDLEMEVAEVLFK